MARLYINLVLVALALAPAAAIRADMFITLEARDGNGSPISTSVALGTTVTVDVLVSVDGADNPLPDVRLLQLDFSATDETIGLISFAWMVDQSVYGALMVTDFDVPAATSAFSSSREGLVSFDGTPLKVASVEVVVNGDGILNAVGGLGIGESSQATFNARFDVPTSFTLPAGNLHGGTLSLTIAVPTDSDLDGDGVANADDAFPQDPTETTDTDLDGMGNNADADDDNDGVDDTIDAFPLDPAEVADSDQDGVGDNADTFPEDPAETIDSDGDGVGDNLDPDDDNDGVNDVDDAFPLDPSEWADSDGDGIGDNADPVDPSSDPLPSVNPCAVGMLGTSFSVLLGLAGFRVRRRRLILKS